MSTADDEALCRAAAWVEHLRSGGSTTWTGFSSSAAAATVESARPQWRELPGAAHLELVRRLNVTGGSDTPTHRSLVDRVLRVSAPGRGQPDLDLIGVPTRSRFGPPPVDPEAVPTKELLRVAAGALAETSTALDPGPERRHRRTRRPWRRGLRLGGAPMAVAGVHAGLAQRGHVTGRRNPVAVVLADDLGAMLADTWSMRLQLGRTPAWRGWLDNVERNDALPPNLKLSEVAARHADELGVGNVHIVVGGDPGAVISELIELRHPVAFLPRRLSVDALEVLRLVNEVFRVLVHAPDHQRILDRVLLPLLTDERGGRRGLPQGRAEWVAGQATRLRDELTRAGYPVHGDLDDLLPRADTTAPDPTKSETLDVALRTLLKMKEGV